MKKHCLFLGLAALLSAAALTSCQKEEWEMDSPSESESGFELAADETRASYTGSNYALSSEWIKNPEKGLYEHVEYKFRDNTLPSVDDIGFADGTLVLLQIYLMDFKSLPISDDALATIRDIFSRVRKANKKAIVRFSYSNDHGSNTPYDPAYSRDAGYSTVLNHIFQLSSILSDYKDYIYVLQGGFIGTYGEWYYISKPEYVYDNLSINSNGFHNRKEIITQMLNAVPDRMVALRTPEFKRRYLNCKSDYLYDLYSYKSLSQPNASGNAHYRLTFYNDVFMVDNGQMQGTFPTTLDDNMWKSQSKCLAVGGETAYNRSTADYMYNEDPIAWIKDYHMSYLNRHDGYKINDDGSVTYSSRLYYKWKDRGLEPSIYNALGYQLWLNGFKMEGVNGGSISAGKNVNMVFSIKNDGAAPVIYQRPMKIVFIRNSDRKVTELASSTGSVPGHNLFFTSDNAMNYTQGSVADIRRIGSGETKCFTCCITLPSSIASGDMIALWMPDQADSLRSNHHYSIRLCNISNTGSSHDNVKWLEYQDRSETKAGFNAIYTF